ncbi:MAG TPA: TolC family protein [Spirochaetota bacterium]|nr:TolC family protein [Spirochaetota bacterium]HPS85689.1 TolC family protein [Spirochaetota bacterium]
MKKTVLLVILLVTPLFSEGNDRIFEIQNSALIHSPKLQSMERETLMMKSRIDWSTALEDPRLKFGVNNLPVGSYSFTKEDMTSKEIGISQMIPVNKLGIKRTIAEKEYEKSLLKLKKEKVEILHELRMNIYELIYIRSSINIIEEIKKQINLVTEREVAASKSGTGTLANVLKSNIEFNMAEEELINLRQKERELSQKINYLSGMQTDIDLKDLPVPEFVNPPADNLKNEILTSNPELKILKIDMEISMEEVRLKQMEYLPDIEVGVSYMQRQDGKDMKRDDMVSGMVSLNIPVWFWKKNAPMIDEMKSKNSAVDSLYKDKSNDFTARADIIISQLLRWQDLYKLYKERLIPQTELTLETNLARYRTGSVEFMPVIDNIRMLLRYRKELNMALKEYYTFYSELNALKGVEVVQ